MGQKGELYGKGDDLSPTVDHSLGTCLFPDYLPKTSSSGTFFLKTDFNRDSAKTEHFAWHYETLTDAIGRQISKGVGG